MKIITLLLISSSIFATKIKFEYNERVNLIRFIFTISDYGTGSEFINLIYKTRNGDNNIEKNKEKIEEFKKLVNSIPRNIDLYPSTKKLPSNYLRWASRVSMLTHLAALSPDMNTFKSSLYSIYPNKLAYELSEIIDYFLPIYRKIYYSNKSKKEVNKLLKYLKKIDIQTKKFFELEKIFYNSKINIPEIKIFIFPLFKDKKVIKYLKENHGYSTKSQSLSTIQVVEAVLPFDKKISWYGVVLHEIAHFCYGSSDLIPKFLLKMKKDDKMYGDFASQYLNEALATAIGNGYVMTQMNTSTGSVTVKKNGKSWYNDKIIDKYAHAIYPIIKKMLDNKKSLNLSQTKEFVKIFKENFPDILYQKEAVFNPLNIISSDDFNYRYLINGIKKYVRLRSTSANSPANNKISIDSYKNSNKKTQVFVLKFNQLNQLKDYKEIDLKKLKKDIKNEKPFVRITFNENKGRFEMFFIINSMSDYKKLIKKIMKLDKIKKGIIYL